MKVSDVLSLIESVMAGTTSREIVEQSASLILQNGFVYTFNDEVTCRAPLDLGVEGAVPADALRDLLRKSDPEQEITFQADSDGAALAVKAGRWKSRLRLEPSIVSAVSKVPWPKKSMWKPLTPATLEGISLVRECASTDTSQFKMTCVHMTADWVEACNGSQLARFESSTGLEESVMVRSSSIEHVSSLGMTRYAMSESWIFFKNAGGVVLGCRKNSAESYPNLTPHMELTDPSDVELPKSLPDAIERASVFVSDDVETGFVSVAFRKGKLLLRGEGAYGQFVEQLAVSHKGKEFQFRISPKLLAGLAGHQHTDTTCRVDATRVRVDRGSFHYVACLHANPTAE
jgi:hypothetical protein